MSTFSSVLQNDPNVGRPIPGQSLTAEPGTMPYENPPQTADPAQAFEVLKAGLYQQDSQDELAQLTRSGMSCETLASAMVMTAFAKGMFNPDIAEIIKPFLAIEIFKISKEKGVEQVLLENKPIKKPLDIDSLEGLKNQALPENKINVSFTPEEQQEVDKMFRIDDDDDDDGDIENNNQNLNSEGFISKPEEVQ